MVVLNYSRLNISNSLTEGLIGIAKHNKLLHYFMMCFYLFLVDDEEDKKPADHNSKDYLFTLFF